MAGESVWQLLMELTGFTGDSAEEVYAQWAGLTISDSTTGSPFPHAGDSALGQLVDRKLTANGKSAQIKESLLATLLAGGAVGESPEQTLLETGLTGWS